MKKPIIHIDLDGVVADFVGAINNHPLRKEDYYKENPDEIPGIFRDLKMIPGAKEAVHFLLEQDCFEVYFLSTAPWHNPSAWTDKRLWLEAHFGDKINRRLTISHRKDLIIGDYLIDDRPNNGAKDFKGKLITFGSAEFPNWEVVLKYFESEMKLFNSADGRS